MRPIELTTDRNSLRKLLGFVTGKGPKSWRIDVDTTEETMFFTRWEENQVQIITGARDSGYGHEFEKSFLSFDSNLQSSSGHHRIARYNLGGIECLVRFEVDGYVDNDVIIETRTSIETINNQASMVDELGQALSGLCVQRSTNVLAPSPAVEVNVIERGRLVDNNAILELKSCSAKLNMQDIIPQLWISQTHHLFVGRHKNGLVEVEPERFNMANHFRDWETKNQEHLSSLVGLITKIKEVAKKAKGGKCMLVCEMNDKPGVLKMYERNGKNFLPRGARGKCWETENQVVNRAGLG